MTQGLFTQIMSWCGYQLYNHVKQNHALRMILCQWQSGVTNALCMSFAWKSPKRCAQYASSHVQHWSIGSYIQYIKNCSVQWPSVCMSIVRKTVIQSSSTELLLLVLFWETMRDHAVIWLLYNLFLSLSIYTCHSRSTLNP